MIAFIQKLLHSYHKEYTKQIIGKQPESTPEHKDTSHTCLRCISCTVHLPAFDDPSFEAYCTKLHWSVVTSKEDWEALKEPIECKDFTKRSPLHNWHTDDPLEWHRNHNLSNLL